MTGSRRREKRMARVIALLVLAAGVAAAADPPAGAVPAVVVDGAGKELKLDGMKFATGVRRLAWLADAKGATEDVKKGPLALELREPNSTAYAKGVVTLIPLSGVESIRYESDKQVVSVTVKGQPAPLTGSLQYKGINAVTFEGTSGGVVGKFSAGPVKGGVKSITFPDAKPPVIPRSPGPSWAVQIDQPKAGDPVLTVRTLKVLYHYLPGGAEELSDVLPVRKGEPLSLAAPFKRLEVLAVDNTSHRAVAELEPAAGPERVVVFPLTKALDKRTGTVVGLLGEVDAGWKLFPLHTIKAIRPAEAK
jgi:hypothetical protein